MQAKWRGHGRITCSCTLLSTVTASAQLWSKTRVLRFSWVSTYVMGTRLLRYSLSRTTTPGVWVSVLVVGKEAYARDAEDEQLTFLWRLVDISDGGTTTTSPRSGDASPTTTWAGCIFFACLSMTQDRTTTYRVTTCATATRLSLAVWHVWRFLVRYNNRGRRRRVDQNDRSFLSFFFHF